MSLAEQACRFLRSTRNGILATHSARLAGYPFGSVTPFVLDHAGNPIILISTLAEHTKNIAADPRVSLLAFEHADDMQAAARLTLVGDAALMDKDDALLRARYLRYLPQAEQYFDTHDFLFHRIVIQQARFIGGFGKIAWIPAADLLPPANRLAEQESAILAHMNTDHSDSLRTYCLKLHGVEPLEVTMIGIDVFGFDVAADGRTLRFDFAAPVTDAQSARTALVGLLKDLRA